ncbi:hypothetical protein CI109_104325 [Kwoniella shandongensis]|uniref:Uncharacterized protein n=1 Tax=Kwoniella shandongensis TaxID=1734106 RepID=A0A5M6BYI8_9TREE|nr:uncharacterized protein CI109_004279 [Kwoniella shandongensis]KAA5527461.1 hypothetical protein CI109_004279 [Kwoniella shandongensis]
MAFNSLADELANAFDDGPSSNIGGSGGGGVSKSLAEEFGLDFDLQEEEREDERVSDEANGNELDPFIPQVLKRELPLDLSLARIHDPESSDELDIHVHEGHSFSPNNGNTQLAEYLSKDDYHPEDIAPAFSHTNRGPTLTSSSGSSKLRPKASYYDDEARSPPRSRADQDPLITLSETIATTSRFLTSLKELDNPSRATSAQVDGERQKEGQTLELRLQFHLGKMVESERVRDEQLRELGVIAREMGVVRWGEGMDPSNSHELQMIGEEDEGEEGYDGGWTGESQAQAVRTDMPTREEEEGIYTRIEEALEDDEDAYLDPHEALLDQSFALSHAADKSLVPPISIDDKLPVLPHQTSLHISDTNNFLAILFALSESLHTSSSLSTSLQRQVRGIRASVETWRARDNQEIEARRLIEEYEERKVREGLSGKGNGVGEKLRKECEEFEERLEEWGKRMEEIRRGVNVMA